MNNTPQFILLVTVIRNYDGHTERTIPTLLNTTDIVIAQPRDGSNTCFITLRNGNKYEVMGTIAKLADLLGGINEANANP